MEWSVSSNIARRKAKSFYSLVGDAFIKECDIMRCSNYWGGKGGERRLNN